MTNQDAIHALKMDGYRIDSITRIPEGANHYVFDVVLHSGQHAIAKFVATRHVETGFVGTGKDTLFGGTLSLEREKAIFDITRDEAKLPAPAIYGSHKGAKGEYLLLEKMNGQSFTAYLKNNNYALPLYLETLNRLGKDIAKAQCVLFRSFGNIIDRNRIEPDGILNFATRFLQITVMRLDTARRKGLFADTMIDQIDCYFRNEFEYLRPCLSNVTCSPCLVFTDMHGENFFVNAEGMPTGYFDLESSQAAHPALEFYGIRFFLMNIFDRDTYQKAEEAFFSGYTSKKNCIDPFHIVTEKLTLLLAQSRMLELSASYYGNIDGVRNTWAERIAKILLDSLESDSVDYLAIGDIFRERDGQPKHPFQ